MAEHGLLFSIILVSSKNGTGEVGVGDISNILDVSRVVPHAIVKMTS